jgi:tetratricopeptide (TPR) repeat protein
MMRVENLVVTLALVLSCVFLVSCATKKVAFYKEDGSPLSITDYEKIAQTLRDDSKYERAIEAYEAIIANYPDNQKAVAWAYYEIAFCYFVLKEYSEAEKYFRIVINDYQEPAATKLAQDMLAKILEAKKK